MNVKDLQVGNYVLCGGTVKKTYIVTAIHIADLVTIQNDDEELDGCLSDRIFPIPITKEILLKNGWIEREDDLVLLQEGVSIRMTPIGGIAYRVEVYIDNDVFVCLGNRIEPVCYVHQLQNILQITKVDKEIEL